MVNVKKGRIANIAIYGHLNNSTDGWQPFGYVDKFKHFGLTPVKGLLEYAPLIKECPINLECVVEHTIDLPSHTLFIGKVIAAHANAEILDEKNRLDLNRCRPLGFCSGAYLASSPLELTLGYSLKKK